MGFCHRRFVLKATTQDAERSAEIAALIGLFSTVYLSSTCLSIMYLTANPITCATFSPLEAFVVKHGITLPANPQGTTPLNAAAAVLQPPQLQTPRHQGTIPKPSQRQTMKTMVFASGHAAIVACTACNHLNDAAESYTTIRDRELGLKRSRDNIEIVDTRNGWHGTFSS